MGDEELGADEKEDKEKLAAAIKELRRKIVTFKELPVIGGASGAAYEPAQMAKIWNDLLFGHKFTKGNASNRALIFSSELFPPNIAKHGVKTSLNAPIEASGAEMKRVLEFMAAKRSKDDVVLFFDGRSRLCRRTFEAVEDKFVGPNHTIAELYLVFTPPGKECDARVPKREISLSRNTTETVYVSLPIQRTKIKVQSRAEFNNCGEQLTSATTYTGVDMRWLEELPRMDYETKESTLGVAASGAVKNPAAQKDLDENGHPFSWCETKPVLIWQHLMDHLGITHIVDFTPGSGALAIAASGAGLKYEGIAGNEAHKKWLDQILDRAVFYLCDTKEGRAGLGADAVLGKEEEIGDKMKHFFHPILMEAKRFMEPRDKNDDGEEAVDNGEDSDDVE